MKDSLWALVKRGNNAGSRQRGLQIKTDKSVKCRWHLTNG